MADRSTIEWTDATWNPITGCSVVSPGCTNCYAMKLAGTRLKHVASRAGLTRETKAGPVWTGAVRFNEETIDQPLRWRRPRMIFVCAHGDLFAEAVPDVWIDRVFAVMALSPQHTFQVLTKRPERMREYVSGVIGPNGSRWWTTVAPHPAGERELGDLIDLDYLQRPLPNVWLGVSVEDQCRADERIPVLLDTPAAVRWISAEPLLGPVNLTAIDAENDLGFGEVDALKGIAYAGPAVKATERLDWIVAGGESGPGARPMHPDWARGLRDQCAAAGVPFLFKQWGAWREATRSDEFDTGKGRAAKPPALIVDPDDGAVHCFLPADPNPRLRVMLQVGKKAAGRELDGVTHDGFPGARL